jgi:hypothetical protein
MLHVCCTARTLTQSIRDLLTQEAQKLLIDAEMRANLLRERYQVATYAYACCAYADVCCDAC